MVILFVFSSKKFYSISFRLFYTDKRHFYSQQTSREKTAMRHIIVVGIAAPSTVGRCTADSILAEVTLASRVLVTL